MAKNTILMFIIVIAITVAVVIYVLASGPLFNLSQRSFCLSENKVISLASASGNYTLMNTTNISTMSSRGSAYGGYTPGYEITAGVN